jgi:hypothetical protein
MAVDFNVQLVTCYIHGTFNDFVGDRYSMSGVNQYVLATDPCACDGELYITSMAAIATAMNVSGCKI